MRTARKRVLCQCASLAAEKSRPLADYFSSMLKMTFEAESTADDFVPSCAENAKLHNLACGRHFVMTDISAVHEFEKKLKSTDYLAILYHQNKIDGKLSCDFVSFRTRDRIFHYSVGASRTLKSCIADALKDLVRRKPVFVFRKSVASTYLRNIFDWNPAVLVDAKALAEENRILPTLKDMVEAFVGGPFCARASHFTGVKAPSQTALRHVDVVASFIYEFCAFYYRHRRNRDSRGKDRHPESRADDSRKKERSRELRGRDLENKDRQPELRGHDSVKRDKRQALWDHLSKNAERLEDDRERRHSDRRRVDRRLDDFRSGVDDFCTRSRSRH